MGFFESRSKKERLTVMQSAIIMAMADGELAEEEIAACAKVATRLGLSDSELNQVLSNPDSIDATIPESKVDRALNIADLAMVANADGVVDKSESEFLARMAIAYGITPEEYAKILVIVTGGGTPNMIVQEFS